MSKRKAKRNVPPGKQAKAQATRAKRRNRWLLVAIKILTSNWRSIAEAVGRLFGQKKE